MNISAWSIKNPLIIVVSCLLAMLTGWYAFHRLHVQSFPDMNLPMVTVSAGLSGASPEQLENDVAKKIENSIASVQGLKNINTTIKEGSVTIQTEFVLEKDPQEALDEVRSAVDTIRNDLPSGMAAPVVTKVNTASSSPILVFGMKASQLTEEELSWIIDNDITRYLLDIKGVGGVKRVGGVTREIHITVQPDVLAGYGITMDAISSQLTAMYKQSNAGKIELNRQGQVIQATSEVAKVEDLNNLFIKTNQGNVRLGDIAKIDDTHKRVGSGALLNGEKIIGFEVARAKGYGETDIAHKVEQAMQAWNTDHPDKPSHLLVSYVTKVNDDFDASMKLLWEGALLAVIVVWAFLRDGRATLVSAVALPLSILPTFTFMYYADFSLNVVTLLSLSLVIGILVDDAIVEVENIARHIHMGKTAEQASLDATGEIGLAVIATTFTLIGVFLPTAFMEGIPGLVFKQFGWTAAVAVFSSLVVARCVTPLLAAKWMRDHDAPSEDPWWLKKYVSIIGWTTAHNKSTIAGAFVFFAISVAMIPLLKTGFIPAGNGSQTQVIMEMEPGTLYEDAMERVQMADRLVRQNPYIEQVYSAIGAGSLGREGGVNTDTRKASLNVTLKPLGSRPERSVVENQMREALSKVPGVKIQILSGGSGEKLSIALRSDDGVLLRDTVRTIEKELQAVPGIGSLKSDVNLTSMQWEWVINTDKATQWGLTTESIAKAVRVATQGDMDMNVAKFDSGVRQIPIVVKMDNKELYDSNLLDKLTLQNNVGATVPLREVVDPQWVEAPSEIKRLNRYNTYSIDIELGGRALGEVEALTQQSSTLRQLPAGISRATTGESERMQELFSGFGMAMLAGVASIYIILLLLFKDWMQPLTILMALPLSLGGAFAGLYLTGQSFSMPSLIGLIMLMGVSTKNSILLVDYAIMDMHERGVHAVDAIREACHKRARPIIMTSLAMGAGMLPVAMQWGATDGSFRAPMAIAVIGGLVTSTALSLLVIPSFYIMMNKLKQKMTR